jgi:hypothetical protein
MRCTKCNTLLQDKARFCSTCGTPVVPSEVDHTTPEDLSISSDEADEDNISLSPVEPGTQLSATSVAIAQGERPSQTSAEITDYQAEDGSAPSGPTQAVATPEQPQHSVAATDIASQGDTEPSEETRIIVAVRVPPRPQHLKPPLDTITTYEMPKPQTYIDSQQRETIAPALQISLRNTGDPIADSPIYQETPPHLPFLSPNTPSPSLPYFRLDTSNKVMHMFPAVVNPQTGVGRRRKSGGLGCLLTLLVLIVIIAGAWSFVLQPFLHNIAEDQLNQALTAAVNQIPAGTSALPTNSLKISENVINNLIVLNTSPSSPIQNPATHITPANIQIDFQLYGLPCSITAVPKVQNNQLVATNTTVSGVIGLVLSPNDISNIVNQHLAAAQTRLQHSVTSVQLKDHEVDLTLS